MATQGTKIQRTTLAGTNLVDSGVINTSGVISAASTTRYHYISCYSFNLLFKGWYQFLGSPHYTVRIFYWNGSSWVDAGGDNDVCNETVEWQINRPSGGYVNVVGPTYIWMVSVKHNSGVSGNTAREMRMWLHGIGETSDTDWNTNVREKKISCLPSGTLYSLGHSTSYSPTDANVYGIYRTDTQRSNLIYASTAHNRFVPKIL